MPATAFMTSVGVGTCCCHQGCVSITGIIVVGSPDKNTEGNANCRLSDLFLASCGHFAIMITGSPNVTVNGLPQCRVGDNFQGSCPVGVLVTGAVRATTN